MSDFGPQDPNDQPTDDQLSDIAEDGHQVPAAPVVDENPTNESQFKEPVASPAVIGEESIAGDAPDGEPQDIDKALSDLGLENDEGGVKPLSSDDID